MLGTGATLYEDPRRSQGMPGTRAPHVPLQRGDTRISTLDLFGTNFCVLVAANGGAFCDSRPRRGGGPRTCRLNAYRVAGGEIISDPDGRFADAYALSDFGAVIVRPDGFVAWRAKDARHASTATVSAVLRSLLCRSEEAQASVAAG